MKITHILLALAILSLASAFADTDLRISAVCEKDAPDSASMKSENYSETLQVKNAALITNTDIASAIAFHDDQRWGVSLTLTPEGAKRFDQVLRDSYKKRIAIIVNGKLISSPTVMTDHAGGRCQITGHFTEAQAREIASDLGKGAGGAGKPASAGTAKP